MTTRYRLHQKNRGHRHPESAPAQISPRACTQLAGKNSKRPYWRGSLEVVHHNTLSQPEVKINAGRAI